MLGRRLSSSTKKNSMNENINKDNVTSIKEAELMEVAGGAASNKPLTVNEWYIYNELGGYKSGDTPKYSVGEMCKIKVRCDDGFFYHRYDIDVRIVSVDGKKGKFCPEYIYTAEIVKVPTDRLTHYIGTSVGNIYESKIK